MKKAEIIVLGNYTQSNHEATRIIDGGGIAPTIKDNHGCVVAILVYENRNSKDKTSNKTRL